MRLQTIDIGRNNGGNIQDFDIANVANALHLQLCR